jgi:hypothetical protein
MTDRLEGEPDLDRPGNPLLDGTEQTVYDNIMELANAAGKEENVTREICESVGIDWRDWKYWIVDLHEDWRLTDERMLSYEANYEATHGVPAPGMAELRARMRKDSLGLTHLDDES